MKNQLFLSCRSRDEKEKSGWSVVSCEPTSSIRFERYGADVVRKFKLRTLIGKTTMGPRTAEALKEVGGVYLSKIGLSGNSLRKQIRKVHDVYFLDELGKTEATWIYEVEEFGPFFVAIDADGNNYFEQLSDDVKKICRKLKAGLESRRIIHLRRSMRNERGNPLPFAVRHARLRVCAGKPGKRFCR